jgi:hypothetical protein
VLEQVVVVVVGRGVGAVFSWGHRDRFMLKGL